MEQYKMKNIFYICSLVYCVILLGSCAKGDQNGDLDGMWQMTQWRDKATGDTIKTQQDGIFYCVQLNLIKIQEGGVGNYHYLAYFRQTSDSLILGKTVKWPAETDAEENELAQYGVPANKRFHIEALTDKNLVLSSEQSILTFRKY